LVDELFVEGSFVFYCEVDFAGFAGDFVEFSFDLEIWGVFSEVAGAIAKEFSETKLTKSKKHYQK